MRATIAFILALKSCDHYDNDEYLPSIYLMLCILALIAWLIYDKIEKKT
jgi:hypothetical protein